MSTLRPPSAPPKSRHRLVLLGPALVAAVAYVDPGNVATNTTAGASTGYLLVWVVVAASLVAALLQYLSAKLGIATGRNLAQHSAARYRTPGRVVLGGQAVLVSLATDLAEVVGGAVALKLLLDLPLLAGATLTALTGFLVLALTGSRPRRFEAVITTMLVLIALGFLYSALAAGPDPGGLLRGVVPALDGVDTVLLAVGMLGATVMPHALYAHSALVCDRFELRTSPTADEVPHRLRLLGATRLDVVIALSIAGAVNLSLLVLAAAALPGSGVDTIEGVHAGLSSTLGLLVATFFALALLFSALASSATATYAGASILEGFAPRWFTPLSRRVLTLVPSLVVLALGVDPTLALVLSQVVLSFGIPFALWPLLRLTSSPRIMGPLVNRPLTTLATVLAFLLVSGLNVTLLVLLVA